MKIITTPMCEDVLEIAGLKDYKVAAPSEISNADVAILLSETKSGIPKISIKLNTYAQVYESILLLKERFGTDIDNKQVEYLKKLIEDNENKKIDRKDINVKVYGNFLKDTVLDMGYAISDENYDYIVMPDYMDMELEDAENVVTIPSHKNVPKNIIQRVTERYELLEKRLCMKQ